MNKRQSGPAHAGPRVKERAALSQRNHRNSATAALPAHPSVDEQNVFGSADQGKAART